MKKIRILALALSAALGIVATAACTSCHCAHGSGPADLPTTSAQSQPVDSLNIIFLGDSNIWLAGDSCTQPKGWVTRFKEYLAPKSCLSLARSGASWSHTSETKANTVENTGILGNDNVIYNQVLRLVDAVGSGAVAKPDVIIISAGGNDAWFHNKRPHEFDSTVDETFAIDEVSLLASEPSQVLTLAGAIRYDTGLLRKAFPDVRIIFMTPAPMAKVSPEMLEKVSLIIIETGARLGIPTVRLDNAGLLDRDAEIANPRYTYDGTHTSEEGARLLGRHVAGKVRRLLDHNQ